MAQTNERKLQFVLTSDQALKPVEYLEFTGTTHTAGSDSSKTFHMFNFGRMWMSLNIRGGYSETLQHLIDNPGEDYTFTVTYVKGFTRDGRDMVRFCYNDPATKSDTSSYSKELHDMLGMIHLLGPFPEALSRWLDANLEEVGKTEDEGQRGDEGVRVDKGQPPSLGPPSWVWSEADRGYWHCREFNAITGVYERKVELPHLRRRRQDRKRAFEHITKLYSMLGRAAVFEDSHAAPITT
ncbi:uncharacterized protein BDZ99DRAFT_481766 [Mytilinidion resinicola]|uniref:Uncharacterized protein n=1 Tax=Mytilinidion resinicola TaxID=574789 RepID=A0A6A6Y6X9_9PEZI|nr:uncharacterized protein BDZ99DRAFT_481766 [Mytilinidion resinicola]KAF2803774.1 hypothetical protein BDZ99DRAFT_481766 [Mytilinidion resinicola]